MPEVLFLPLLNFEFENYETINMFWYMHKISSKFKNLESTRMQFKLIILEVDF